MSYEDIVVTLRERTRPAPTALQRVRQRLDLQLASAKPELMHLPAPSPDAVARVAARLRGSVAPRPNRVPLVLGLGIGGLALAAAIGVAVDRAPFTPVHEERALTGAATSWQVDGLTVDHDGDGTFSRDGHGVAIDWEYGRLVLALDPQSDLSVAVRTPEGEVRLTGTRVVVERGPLGTRIAVEEGTAEVGCGEGPLTAVSAQAERMCLPRTAAGWLNRVHALAQSGTSGDALLAEIDSGLSAPGRAEEQAELWTVRVNTLLSVGRMAEALDSAEHALPGAADPERAASLHRTAARIALSLGDCARALPHLDALPTLDADEAAHRSRCSR